MSDFADDLWLLEAAIPLHNAGKVAEAEEIYRRVLARNPQNPDALHLMGVAAAQSGRLKLALELIGKAIAIIPGTAVYYRSLADAQRQMGMMNEAHGNLQTAIELNPADAITWDRMGGVLLGMGRVEEALKAFGEYSRLEPGSAEGHNNVGVCLKELGRLEEAIAAYRRAIGLKPGFAEAHNNLGVCLKEMGEVDEAIGEYSLAAKYRPEFPEAHNNLGVAMQAKAQVGDAIAAFRRTIELSPNFGGAHYNLALSLLQNREFSEGWAEHEWRWQAKGFPSPKLNYVQPMWDGSDLRGKTILLHCEQGFGDSIQFVRYVPMVAARGARVVLWPPPELVRLFQCVKEARVVATTDECGAFDVHCPLMSLPGIFKTDLESIPANVPYLRADPALVERWKVRMPRDGKPAIGLAWAGRRTHLDDRQRSIRLADLAILSGSIDATFYSLQKGEAAIEIGDSGESMNMLDWTAELNDFADTAGLIANLDLVISVDTAAAHLAGAMGKPVWVLLPFSSDWRWMRGREDSPWYPTMRLFRQKTRGDWETAIGEIARKLQ